MSSELDPLFDQPVPSGTTFMPKQYADAIIYSMCLLSIGFAILQVYLIRSIKMDPAKV
jgi:hypothetical protein